MSATAHATRPPAQAHASAPPAQAAPARQVEAPAPQPLMTSLSAVPAVQRKCDACAAQDHEEMPVQPRLKVGAVDDRLEREADAVAARVMAMRAPAPAVPVAPEAVPGAQVQRVSTAEDEDDTPRMRAAQHSGGAGPDGGETIAASAAQLSTGGTALPPATRAFFEPRMGRDLSGVRLHQGAESNRLTDSISARAFTFGNHIWLGRKETTAPGFTLAHELAHVMQQGGATAAPVRRLTHGPSTPTNCHNWRIPLPPWIAGSMAHAQAAVFFAKNPGSAGRVLPEVGMPRGSKVFKGMPSKPIFPHGFMDLVGLSSSTIQIGEIKSTASAAKAMPEAAHYLRRHNEWLARAPWTEQADINYGARIGGSKPGVLMSGLSSVTGTGVAVGPFMGDPLKTLHLEADSAGAICYWCTGVGTTNPAWAKAFQKAMKKVQKAFWDAYRTMMDGIRELLDWIGDNPVMAFVVLLVLVIFGILIAIASGFLEIPSGGTSTAPLLAGLALALSAGTALLAMLGVDVSGFEPAAEEMTAALGDMAEADDGSASGYEKFADHGAWKNMTASGNKGPERIEKATGNFVAAAETLPGKISSRALDIINPLSDAEAPTLTKSKVEKAREIADVLAKNPDSEIAKLGRDAQDMARKALA